jgi:endo-1,4-beta-xylanase
MTTRHLAKTMLVATIVSIAAMGCGKSAEVETGNGGATNRGGTTATGGSGPGSTASGGKPSAGGQTGAGGTVGSGGLTATGGSVGASDSSSAGGIVASGGTVETGGRIGAGGIVSRGGATSNIFAGAGGAGSGGTMHRGGASAGTSGTTVGRAGSFGTGGGTGGIGSGGTMQAGGGRGGTSGPGAGRGGTLGNGGVATGGSSTGTTAVTIDCNTAMPSNGVQHSGNTQGTSGNFAWQLWSNGTGPTMTTFDVPAFRLTWGPDSGDVLGRLGLDFADGGMTYDQYGTITAQFAENKSGTGGGYSYIGIYGFSADPCVEFYIVDDSYSEMPIKPYSTTNKGTVTIDGGSYALYSGTMSSTGDSSCRGSVWSLFYSVRQTARTCGQISITQHFDAWKAAGMKLGNLLEVKVLVEVGGGTGSIDVPIANVTIDQ